MPAIQELFTVGSQFDSDSQRARAEDRVADAASAISGNGIFVYRLRLVLEGHAGVGNFRLQTDFRFGNFLESEEKNEVEKSDFNFPDKCKSDA